MAITWKTILALIAGGLALFALIADASFVLLAVAILLLAIVLVASDG